MAGNYTEVTLRTPHFDGRGRLYRPGRRRVPVEVARLWGYAAKEEAQGEEVQSGAGGTAAELPQDFPGRAALVEAGLTTREAVAAKSREELIALKGIGEKTADEIAAALK